MAMKPRTGRTRISKASEVVSEKAKEVLSRSDENLGAAVPARRRPDSKADEIERKITSEAAPAVSAPIRRRPDSKADEIERKISPEVKPAASAPARRRPDSKADDIERKVPSAVKPAADSALSPNSGQEISIAFSITLCKSFTVGVSAAR